MKRIKYTILTLVALFALTTRAQTVKWMVKPQFASIKHYSDDIFKCIDPKGELKLIDWYGQSISIPSNADSVTDYSDGYAIVLHGDEILGFLPEAKPHTFQPVGDGYYATKYSFFSEGYIAVAKGSTGGKQGYLDSKGNPVLECKYVEAMPVRKGRALVIEKGKDKDRPRYKRAEDWSAEGLNAHKVKGTAFIWATTFNSEGQALVRLGNNKKEYVVIDVNFNEIGKKENGSKELVNSYDYSYKPEGSQEVKSIPNAGPVKNNDCFVYNKEGKKGYKSSVEEFVPAQFSAAEDFYDGRAIVSMGNGYGIIELLDGKFEPNWPEERVRVYEDAKKVNLLQFTLKAPASLDSKKVKLEFDKGDGHYIECKELHCDNFKLADQVIGTKSSNCTLHAKATYTDNLPALLLWEDESKPINIDYINIGLSTPSVTSEYADENDNQTVKAVVTNNSTIPVKVSVTINVAGKTRTVNLDLDKSQSQPVTVTVKVDNDKQVQATVSAKVDNQDCGHNSSYVTLKKI